MEYRHKQVSHTRHNQKLCDGTNEDILGTTCQHSEIIRGQRQTHGQHDESQNHGLRGAMNPTEQIRKQKCQYRNGNNKQ